ncbi:MAG: prepilin peptidase, partial [Lachnospiraceae bacterium]|nr:prepilin peptidase [Lachnospiraceae bacterium]
MERIEMVSYFLLGGCLGLSAWKDIRTRTISAWVCLAFGAAGAVLAGVRCFGAGSPEALISAALGTLPALLMLAVSKWTKGALGMGDVMLFGV